MCGDPVGAVLGAGEDDGAVHVPVLEEPGQEVPPGHHVPAGSSTDHGQSQTSGVAHPSKPTNAKWGSEPGSDVYLGAAALAIGSSWRTPTAGGRRGRRATVDV